MKRADLERSGFVGWMPLIGAVGHASLPRQPGTYAVSYSLRRPEAWPGASCGGWHKGRDPSVPADLLHRRWVDGSDIVYIGKTDRTLARRISEFARFGAGMPVAHWGGRLIWQLPRVEHLTIGWRTADSGQAAIQESQLLAEFEGIFGCLPFANLRR